MFRHYLRLFLISILLTALGHWVVSNLAFLWLRPLSFLDVPAQEWQAGLYSFTLAAPMAHAVDFPASLAGLQGWMLVQSLLFGFIVALFVVRKAPLRFAPGLGGRIVGVFSWLFIIGAGLGLFILLVKFQEMLSTDRFVTLRADASSPLTLEQRVSTIGKIIPLKSRVVDARFECHFGGERRLRGAYSGDIALKVSPAEVDKWLVGGSYKKANPAESDEMRGTHLLAAGWLPQAKAEFYRGKRGNSAEIWRGAGVVLLHYEPVMRD